LFLADLVLGGSPWRAITVRTHIVLARGAVRGNNYLLGAQLLVLDGEALLMDGAGITRLPKTNVTREPKRTF
jgi:hypothetical protein